MQVKKETVIKSPTDPSVNIWLKLIVSCDRIRYQFDCKEITVVTDKRLTVIDASKIFSVKKVSIWTCLLNKNKIMHSK